MTGQELQRELETFNEQFYKKIELWVLSELGKICDKYDVSVDGYSYVSITDNKTEESYERYTRHAKPEGEVLARFDKIFDEVEAILDVIETLDYRYQSFCYSKEAKHFS